MLNEEGIVVAAFARVCRVRSPTRMANTSSHDNPTLIHEIAGVAIGNMLVMASMLQ
jgi:hypothetical protein